MQARRILVRVVIFSVLALVILFACMIIGALLLPGVP